MLYRITGGLWFLLTGLIALWGSLHASLSFVSILPLLAVLAGIGLLAGI
jgi:hypothetical protein